MRSLSVLTALLPGAFAARPFLNEPDTGIDEALGSLPVGQLPNITDMIGLNDFDWAARRYLPLLNYTYYRNGAGGEWSYRNNLEVFNRYRLKPRVMSDITGVEASLSTTILGYQFAAPFFISPCARGEYGHPDAELNIMKGAGSGNVLYIVSGFSSKPIEEIVTAKARNQTFFSQLYTTANDTANQILFDRAEAAGAKALVWAIDAPGSPSRQRASRQGVTSAVTSLNRIDYDVLAKYRNQTKLPIILKGIQSAADARAAIQHNVPAIILSNHGGRNLDGSPSSLEIALEIYKEDPNVFKEIEVLADGGIRYGTDALRLLALGVKAVGLGRPFMYANVFGVKGIEKAVSIIRSEIMNDAANLGVGDLKTIDASFVNWEPNHWYS